ncbi:MAG TPA: hypothetical protein VK645_06270 [Chitinophagaceae bacterium]|nr:hypothetical protein [Chitinophagaceae bacterium]
MQYTKLIKGLVLLGFIFSITGFLLYRMGKFDNYFQNKKSYLHINADDSAANTNKNTTLNNTLQDSSLPSLSKSVLIDNNKTEVPGGGNGADSLKLKERIMMSGSKSGILIRPEQLNVNKLHFFDTIKIKKNRK